MLPILCTFFRLMISNVQFCIPARFQSRNCTNLPIFLNSISRPWDGVPGGDFVPFVPYGTRLASIVCMSRCQMEGVRSRRVIAIPGPMRYSSKRDTQIKPSTQTACYSYCNINYIYFRSPKLGRMRDLNWIASQNVCQNFPNLRHLVYWTTYFRKCAGLYKRNTRQSCCKNQFLRRQLPIVCI